jgi:peroxiredoxin
MSAAPMQAIQPWLGVAIDEKVTAGVSIKAVLDNTPAQKAGLQAEDLIQAIDDSKVNNRQELMDVLRNKGVGHAVTVHFKRKGKDEKRNLKLEALPDATDLVKRQLLNKAAPAFSITTVLDNKVITEKDLIGKVTILEFWATWCPACRSAIPRLNEWTVQHKNVQIIGITDEDADLVKRFLRNEKINYTIALDREGKIQTSYQMGSIPAFILIDQKGYVREVTIGAGEYLNQLIRKAEQLTGKL